MHYRFEEAATFDSGDLEVIVRGKELNQEVNDIMTYLSLFQQSSLEIIPIKTSDRIELLKVAELILVDVDGTSLILETMKGRHSINDRLYRFQKRLNNPDFVQVSKHAFINISHLQYLEDSFSGNMTAFLSKNLKADISRRYLKDLEKRLGL